MARGKKDDDDDDDDDESRGFLAAPGVYTVSLSKRVDGVETDLKRIVEFEVQPMTRGTLPGADPDRVVLFMRNVAELRRTIEGAKSAIDETAKNLEAVKQALLRSTVDDSTLDDETRRLAPRRSRRPQDRGPRCFVI